MDCSGLKTGDKVKTRLVAISCATGKEDKLVEWKHWWKVEKVKDSTIILIDIKGERMEVSKLNGKGLGEKTNHWVYKIKSS